MAKRQQAHWAFSLQELIAPDIKIENRDKRIQESTDLTSAEIVNIHAAHSEENSINFQLVGLQIKMLLPHKAHNSNSINY